MTDEQAPLSALTRLLMVAEELDNYGEIGDADAEVLREIHGELHALLAQSDQLRAALTELIHASRGLAFFDQIKCERWNNAYARAREVVGLEEEQ